MLFNCKKEMSVMRCCMLLHTLAMCLYIPHLLYTPARVYSVICGKIITVICVIMNNVMHLLCIKNLILQNLYYVNTV